MCFYDDGDYDWIARHIEDEITVAGLNAKGGARRCVECRAAFRPNEQCRRVLFQEYEGCKKCDRDTRLEIWEADCDRESEGLIEEVPSCEDGEHDYGEMNVYHICIPCNKLLDAIKRVEEDDGCYGQETQPSFGELKEAFGESDHALEYLARATVLYPELALSGHLGQFYERTHEWSKLEEDIHQDLGPVEAYGGEG